ncbi:MAG: hypothetical protein ACM3TU_00995 [Bacillota bacterium]
MNPFERVFRQPKEEQLSSKELRHEALSELRDETRYDGVHPYFSIDRILEVRDRWVAKGAFTEEEANALPEMKQAAIQTLVSSLGPESHYADIVEFMNERKRWNEAGIMSIEEVNSIPEIKDRAYADITSVANGHPQDVEDVKNLWRQTDIATEKEMDEWVAESKAWRREEETS